MTEQATVPVFEPINHEVINAALAKTFRELRLEHARMGRTVSQWRDGKVVELSPAEVFAEYGLDEFGRPNPPAPEPGASAPPFAKERAEDRSWLAQLERAGTLEKYRGQYVIAANKEILAVGPELLDVHPRAEKRAEEMGVPAERLLLYFVAGLE